jgi:hypothetical protein
MVDSEHVNVCGYAIRVFTFVQRSGNGDSRKSVREAPIMFRKILPFTRHC